MNWKRGKTGEGTEDVEHFTVREGKFVYVLGILVIAAGILLLVLELFHHINPISLWVYGGIFLIVMSGVACCLAAKNRRLEVDGSRMCYVNFLGKRREFTQDDIGYIRAANPSKGQDSIRLYDRRGGKICRLEGNMHNSLWLLRLLCDRGIRIETPDEEWNPFAEIVAQEKIPEESVKKTAENVCQEAGLIIEAWENKNRKTGARIYYGLAQYYAGQTDSEAEIQPEESRYLGKAGDSLPEDYICSLEVYVKKDGCFIRDRKKRLLRFCFPVVYKARFPAGGREAEVYWNKRCVKQLKEVLETLQDYLPRHRFYQESFSLGYELKKTLP